MAYDRRKLLKYMAGTSAAGLLAGCGGGGNGNGNGGNGNGDDETVTTFTQTETEECGGYPNLEPESSEGSVLYWHSRSEGEVNILENSRDAFNDQYDPSLSLSRIPSSNFQAKLQSAIPSGEGPHLFEWAHDVAGSYDESGFLADKSDSLRVQPCQYTDRAWNAAQYKDQTIGLPYAAETVTLIYNADVVDEPPETLEEMKSIMDDYHDPGAGQYGLGFPINPYYVSGFAQAYGTDIYNGEEDSLGVASDDVLKGLNVVFQELLDYMPEDPGAGAQNGIFTNGNAAFHINGPWQLATLNDAGLNYGLTTLPELPDGGTPRPYMGVRLIYFAKKAAEESTNGQAAREYAEWFTTNQRRILEHANEGGFIPVHETLAENEELPSNVQSYAQQVRQGYPMPANPKMNQVWGPFGDALTNAFNNPGQLESELESAAESIQQAWEDA